MREAGKPQGKSRAKRNFFKPFNSKLDQDTIVDVMEYSIYNLHRLPNDSDTIETYQLEYNSEKIKEYKLSINLAMQFTHRTSFYNRLQFDYSVEVKKLLDLIKDLKRSHENEKQYKYSTESFSVLVNKNLHMDLYREYKKSLDTLMKEKLLPAL